MWYNYATWTLTPNNTNIISRAIVGILHSLPMIIITFIFMTLLVIFLKNMVMNKRGFIGYFIIVVLFEIALSMAISYLMLENKTIFLLFQIEQVIPLEHYIYYLNYSLNSIVLENPTLNNVITLQQLSEYLILNVDTTYLQTLNAQQILEYASKLVTNFDNTMHGNILNPINTMTNTTALIAGAIVLADAISPFGAPGAFLIFLSFIYVIVSSVILK
jgi:hypothetical protein